MGKFDLKKLDRNLYLQFMDATTYRPVSLKNLDLERYGRIKFQMKHTNGFVEYIDPMSDCTIEDFLGDQLSLNNETLAANDSIKCPNNPEKLKMLNSFSNYSESTYL